jgi:hypothetical protein
MKKWFDGLFCASTTFYSHIHLIRPNLSLKKSFIWGTFKRVLINELGLVGSEVGINIK